jgi:hypothetical protein
MHLTVSCAICGETVAAEGIDPCALVVVTRWNRPKDEQGVQQWFCHSACAKATLHPTARTWGPAFDDEPETAHD